MDPGLIKLLEDDEDDTGTPVSGADVDAFAAVLKGELGGSAAAYGIALHGNGSFRLLDSQSSALSSVSDLTGHNTPVGPGQIAQWHQHTQQQQFLQHQRLQCLQQQQQPGRAPKRSGGVSQGISFGALMPLLQPHLPPEQNQQLNALYQQFKRTEITREDFVRGARLIAGDQVLVQMIRQMYLKQQRQQPLQMQSQQSGSSVHPLASSTPTVMQATPSKPMSDQASISKPMEPPAVQPATQQSSPQTLPALSLQQQQPNPESQLQPSSQTREIKSMHSHVQAQQGRPADQQQGETGQGTSHQVSSPALSQQVHEVDKSQLARQLIPQPLPASTAGSVASIQLGPSSLGISQTLGSGVQLSQQQAQRIPYSGMQGQTQLAQPKLLQGSGLGTSSQPPSEKPLSKYARQKLRKEQKKREEQDERTRKVQEEDRLRRMQSGAPELPVSSHPPPPQFLPLQPIPLKTPQLHSKLLEKQQAAQMLIPAKQEPLNEHHSSGLQKSQMSQVLAKGQDRQAAYKSPRQLQLSNTASLPIPVSKDFSVQGLFGEQGNLTTAQAGGGLPRFPSIPTTSSSLHSGFAAAAASSGMSAHHSYESSMLKASAPLHQVGQQLQSGSVPARVAVPVTMTSATPLSAMPVTVGGVPGYNQALMQIQGMSAAPVSVPPNAAAKMPPKGTKKPAETMSQPLQPLSKKPKVQGGDVDQSIDHLNDVTAVSGVNLWEEEEQLLAVPKKESRTTEAMRKVVQQEEEHLFLEKGPLRTKIHAIAAKSGIRTVGGNIERCLSMSAEERLRDMLYELIKLSKQRCDVEKDRHKIVVTSDSRRQVLLMKKKANEALENKQAKESERLRKLTEKKDKGSLADDEKEELRVKALKAQQEDDDKLRANAANVAARAAVGADDMLMKWQMMAAQGLAKRQGGDSANDAGRSGTTNEMRGSQEVERKPENGETATGLGPGRPDADGDGPTAAAATGRPPGPGPGGISRVNTNVRQAGIASHAGRTQCNITLKDVIAFLEREPQMSKSTLLYRLYERERKLPSETGAVKRM